MPKQRWGRVKVEGTTVHGVRNLAKPYLTEGLSRTEKDTSTKQKDFSGLVDMVKGILENGEYSHELMESDEAHVVKLLGVKDCKPMGDNACLTIEMEMMKKHPDGMKVKVVTFVLTCNPQTAKVSADYKGDHMVLIKKLVAAVQKALRK